MYVDKELNIVLENAQYTDEDGTKYPKGFPKSEIKGLIKVTETPKPTDGTVIVTGFHTDKTYTQVWDTEPKPVISAEEQALQDIMLIEEEITPRMMRNALLGDSYAISKIKDIENRIKLKRAK